jgi:hypothetical protein
MFCYQRSFGLPTEVVTKEQFRALITAPETYRKVREAREALARGDKNAYDNKKKGLPFVIFIATYDESDKTFENKQTGEKTTRRCRWRNQKYCRLNGLCVIDFDHVTPLNLPEGEKGLREIWDEAYAKLSDEDKARILLVYITPSGHGLKVVFMADVNVGNLIDNQIVFSKKLGLNPDEACKDASRGAFLTTENDIILLDERIFTYENPVFGEKYNEAYHEGKSQATIMNTNSTNLTNKAVVSNTDGTDNKYSSDSIDSCSENNPLDPSNPCSVKELVYHGVPYSKIVEAWLGDKKVNQGDRHRTSLVLADHLRYITDNDPVLIEKILRETPFVNEIVKERNEDVTQTVKSALGYEFLKGIPRRMQQALEKVGASSDPQTPNLGGSGAADDIYALLPLDKWAEELQEMAAQYPCLKELFQNVHPHKLPAVFFSSAALFGTLMTRAWYHFWYEPELIRRLNYCIFIIGDPGAGKNIVEKFYKKIADPMIQADSCLIDAVNRYKEGRTERTTSTKAQKDEALKRPVVGIRVHPARTATGEFIRHMQAAVENIQGRPLNLHMFSFDAELDNVTKQNKGGDWKDREILELKAFHNEEDGQMYANQESVTGMFNVFWNFIYTGTPYALHRKVNQRNFGTGMSTRLAVIPLPDKGMAQRHQQVDPDANDTLRTWAYRLDRVEGEIPIELLNDETYEWQSSHLEIAEFNGDKADRTLLKRIPYYGIGVSLPFILMRHWDEWQESRTLTMDDTDRRLCRLAMEIQYKCQQFFFGEMAYNYFADQNKEFVVRRRTTRYDECYRKLPDEFKTQQMMDSFQCSQPTASRSINRFLQDGIIERIAHGKYRKILQELP